MYVSKILTFAASEKAIPSPTIPPQVDQFCTGKKIWGEGPRPPPPPIVRPTNCPLIVLCGVCRSPAISQRGGRYDGLFETSCCRNWTCRQHTKKPQEVDANRLGFGRHVTVQRADGTDTQRVHWGWGRPAVAGSGSKFGTGAGRDKVGPRLWMKTPGRVGQQPCFPRPLHVRNVPSPVLDMPKDRENAVEIGGHGQATRWAPCHKPL